MLQRSPAIAQSLSPERKSGLQTGPTADAVAALRHHPRLAEAIRRSARLVIDLYRGNRLVNLISNDRGRFVLACLALYLHSGRRLGDPASGLTATRLKELCADQGVCSTGRAAAMIAMMRWAGYLEPAPPTADRRLRLLMPTARLVDMHRLRWRRQLEAASLVLPELEAALARFDHPAFLPAFAVAFGQQFLDGVRPFDHAPELKFFADRNAGVLVLMSMAVAGEADDELPPARPVVVSAAGLAKQFHVSRTHMITMLQAAVDADLLERPGPDNRFRMLPCLRDGIQNFMAAGYLYNAAAARLALNAVERDRAAA